jgi:rRNA processing protein Gar1
MGEQKEKKDLTILFKNDPTNKMFDGIFSAEELDRIAEEGEGEIIFVEQALHKDDTIETLKKKLLQQLIKDGIRLSFYELYFFAQQYAEIDTLKEYSALTGNNRTLLTRSKLAEYVVNIEETLVLPFDKEEYTYDEFVHLFPADKKMLINIPVGQKLLPNNNITTYVVNPYTINATNNAFLERPVDKIITTLNQALLLSVGDIQNNLLFFCGAAEVMEAQAQAQAEQAQAEQAQAEQAPEEQIYNTNLVKFYFPFLIGINLGAEENVIIVSRQDIDEHKEALMLKTEEMLQRSGFLNNVRNIDLFYNLYNGRTKEMPYSNKGIKNLELTIYPPFEFSLPLDIVFKLIHATEHVPLIKYNPSKRMEKIYRLYANKLATNGKNIPYLNKNVIFKLMKDIGKTKSVTVYLEISATDTITCMFESNGSITLKANFSEIVAVDAIDAILKTAVNPLIQIVKDYIEQSGYAIHLFQGLTSNNVEINTIDYEFVLPIEKKLKLPDIFGCLNSVFSVSTADTNQDNYTMRFKRVSNYNEMTDQEAFITDSLNHKQTSEDIIEGLKLNYQLSTIEATLKLTDFVSSQDISQKAFKSIQLKNSPGFLTTITRNPMTNLLTITVFGINDVQYLTTVPVYIDTLLRITQDKATIQLVKQVCAPKKAAAARVEEEAVVADIIAAKEMAFRDRDDEDVDIIPAADIKALVVDPLLIEEEAAAEEKEEKKEEKLSFFDRLFKEEEEDDEEKKIEEEEEEEESEEEEDEDTLVFGGAQKMVNFKMPSAEAAEAGLSEEEEAEASSSDEESEKLKIDWTGKSLTHPNPFFTRMQERDPSLFLTHEEGVYGAYISACAWTKSHRKQPVILTDKEKKEIDAKHPGSYENAIEYGSNPDKKFWYICPRYWSLRDNVSLTDEEVKSGKYGKIIPADAKKIGKGENIFDFTDTKYHIDAKTNTYMNLHPGFQSEDSHPQGKCIPCCFKSWDSPGQRKRREQCGVDAEGKSATKPAQATAKASLAPAKATTKTTAKATTKTTAKASAKEAAVNASVIQAKEITTKPLVKEPLVEEPEAAQPLVEEPLFEEPEVAEPEKAAAEEMLPLSESSVADIKNNYIKNIDKFPLNRNNYGYLPIAVQKFLHTDNKKCQISLSNTNLKLNRTCFLRHGVEAHKSQSFVACIADIWSGEISDGKTFISIREMKKKLIDSMTITLFTQLQNGNLVDIFSVSATPQMSAKAMSEKAKPLFVHDAERQEKAVAAYANFQKFLLDDTVEINYTYLWDLICLPNKNIFIKGVNLVILELKNDDVTDKIELICPSNHYASSLFDINKNSILILKKDNYYEPIYTRMDTEKDITINRSFNLRYKGLLQNIKTTLALIKKTLNGKCGALPSLPNVYTFEKNIPLKQLIALVQTKKYTVEKQVIHYNDKTVGIVVSKNNLRGMLPCYPSAPVMDLDYIWLDESDVSLPYKETIDFLNAVYKEFVPSKVLCKPKLKVVQDNLIVGVLTQTNQLLTLSAPEQDIYGEDESSAYALPTFVTETDINAADKTQVSSSGVDNERVEFIKKIRLETEFYNVFRNTIRTVLGEYAHKSVKEELETLLLDEESDLLYLEKLRLVADILKKLLLPHIVGFTDYKDVVSLPAITNCYNADATKCAANTFCSTTKDKTTCQLLLPARNLINGQENAKLYFGRIADELLRYSRIQSFIFQPKAFLSLSNLKYNLNADEIILLQSLLTQDYFKDLIQAENNPYVNTVNSNTYDTANPLKTAADYSTTIDLEESIEDIESEMVECEKQTTKKLESTNWSKIFPKETYELAFNASAQKKNNICSFELILTVIKQKNRGMNELTKEGLKEALIEGYEMYIEKKYKTELLDILRAEGKKVMTNQILAKQITFEEMIRSGDYYATLLDMWILAEIYKVPLVFISSKKLVENDKLNLVIKVVSGAAASEAGPSEAGPSEVAAAADAADPKYFFVKVPAVRNTNIEKTPSYKLIYIDKGTSLFPLSILDGANEKIVVEKEDSEEEEEMSEEEDSESSESSRKAIKMKTVVELITNVPIKLEEHLQKLYKINNPVYKKKLVIVPNKN